MTDRLEPDLEGGSATAPTVLRPPVHDVVKVLAPIIVVGLWSAYRLAGAHPSWFIALLLPCLAGGSAAIYRQLTMRIELHPEELVVVNWRHHHIPRADVAGVEVGRVLLTPRAFVLTHSGRRLPLSGLDGRRVAGDRQRFSAEVACVQEWWRAGGA